MFSSALVNNLLNILISSNFPDKFTGKKLVCCVNDVSFCVVNISSSVNSYTKVMPSCVVNISSVCVAIEIISVPIVIKYGSNPSLVRYPPIDIFSLLSILALADNGFSISCNTVLN